MVEVRASGLATSRIEASGSVFTVEYTESVSSNGKKHVEANRPKTKASESQDITVRVYDGARLLSPGDYVLDFKDNKDKGTGKFRLKLKAKRYKEAKKTVKGQWMNFLIE